MIKPLAIALFLSISSGLFGKQPYRFHTFSPEGGFYYNGISSITQDKEGIIWFITDNDLYRFDGYNHKRYHASFGEGSFVSGKNRQFNSLAADKTGNIFVATGNGLFVYDRPADTFRRISAQASSYLHVDTHDKLWLVQEGVLTAMNPDGTVDKPLFEGKPLSDIVSYAGDERSLFVASNRKIYRYDYEALKFTVFLSFDSGTTIQSISRYRNKLWALIDNRGLLKIDIPTAKVEQSYDFFHKENGGNVLTKMICTDNSGSVWIATQKGLYVFNSETETHTHYVHSESNPFSLPNNSVWSICEDRQQNIWVGTYSGGLCYINLDENAWLKSYTPLESPLNNKLVSGFAEDEASLWITTEGGGVNRMNRQSGEFTCLKQDKARNSLAYDNTKSILYDAEKRLWIAMFRGGLDCYDTKTGRFTHFRHNPENENSLLADDLRKILLAGDTGLWIIYQLNKPVVSFYSFREQTFMHYYLDEDYAFIHDFYPGNNCIWLVSEKLYRLDAATKEVKSFSPENGLLNAQTVCVDENDVLWIGTVGRGLIKFNPRTEEFTIYDEILRLNVYSIFSLCIDDESNLWLGTDNGLFRYEIATNQYQRFDKQDGIQGQVFYPLAAFKSRKGELYFGGTNGFTILEPKLLSRNTRKPNVVITGFYIDNQPAVPPHKQEIKALSFPGSMVLNHNQSTFGFEFSSDNYLTPEKNRFRYRLLGYEDQWTEIDASRRFVSYVKIPSGDYRFEVMTANNDGIWNPKPFSIAVKRLPPPWFSLFAYGIYTLLLGSIVSVFFWQSQVRKKMKLQLYLETVDKQKKEEIHRSQLRFFTNISHDFRTPLFLIIAVLEKLGETGWKQDYHRILDNNAQRLLNLVNELMDFRTIENGKMPLQVSPVDVNHLVNAIAYDFRNYAVQKEIAFRLECDERLPAGLYADKHILEKILLNLLNNAFKYTDKGGEVCIATYRNAADFQARYANHFTVGDSIPEDSFLIVVRDTGIGISKESIAGVFERFYKVNTNNADSHLGTGIGLALVKSLTLLHKGAITIFSERKQGTDMVVYLSADSSCYTKEETEAGSAAVSLGAAGETETKILSDKKRLLLAEDNDDLRTLIADSLSFEFEVVEAADGMLALDLLRKMEIDIIVSDIMMPEKDGISLCREVKSDVNLSHIPVILLTAKTGLDSKLEGVDSGADLYFEKPVDSRLLCASIQNIFTIRKNLQEYYAKNYFADTSELAGNKQDREFLRKFIHIVEQNLAQSEMDVNYIASELHVSRSKLYKKVKDLTNKSIVEFILNYRLRKAARLLVEEDISIREIMEQVGIESQSYFTSAFKKEFKETPLAFAKKHSKNVNISHRSE